MPDTTKLSELAEELRRLELIEGADLGMTSEERRRKWEIRRILYFDPLRARAEGRDQS